MYGDNMAKRDSAPKHSAPVELTEEEVRAAREGKGEHKLMERKGQQREYPPVKPGQAKKSKG
jgi:hypothetical protein